MKKVLYFSHVNWSWIKQRPHFIPYYIAKCGMEVTYLSLNSITSFISTNRLKLKNSVEEKNLKIKEVKVLPFGSRIKVIGLINYFLIQRRLKGDYNTIILTHPSQLDYISPEQRKKQIIYECMDNHPFFFDNKKVRELLIQKEKILCNIASKIIVSSLELKRRLQYRYSIEDNKIDIVFNALDDDTILNSNIQTISLNKPNLVYVGTIGSWFDFKVISNFAERNSEYTIYLVGPVEKSINLKSRELPGNVVFVGAVEHHGIFKYIRSGDIMILPFKVNDIIECVDPVKIYEYIALNKPIVSSYWEELEKFGDKVNFYNDARSFETVITSINLCSIKEKVDTNFIACENWKERIKKYLEII